jgi:hypothetical protein
MIIFSFILSSCNLPFFNQAPTATQNPTNTAGSTNSPTLPVETATLGHTTVPGDPIYSAEQVAPDCDTGARLTSGSNQVNISGCDYWNREWLERPADSATGTYVPALDILWAQTGKSAPWIFLKIKIFDLSHEPDGYKAGFEIDTDLDSRGEYLLLANQPTSTTWTTTGVQVWQDTNGDVGGARPFVYDQNNSDGYETKVFDSGAGQDPDLAWVRIPPKDPNVIEFAIKSSILINPKKFGWWAWVGQANLTPDKFELVDHDQDAQSWDLDNTCSWIYGEMPVAGELANLCAVAQPTSTPSPTNIPGKPRPTSVPRPTPVPTATQIIIR